MSLEVITYTPEGSPQESIALEESVFGIVPNKHVLYLALRREQLNAMAGTASAKTRAEVRGGGRKPWKQKGTGRARHGSIRSPLWVGGGKSFGPKPRSFSVTLTKKVRRLAMRSALSAIVSKIKLVEDFSFLEKPSTAKAHQFFTALGVAHQSSVLVLADYKAAENKNLSLSVRNLPSVQLSLESNLSIHALLKAKSVVLTRKALSQIQERYVSNV
jgi:large subunit ribosomal protein L4